jgi:uncharacterized protein with ParB-like and HNH nuclease domain
MQTELFSVSKLFTENLFRIPDYQRGYAWRDRHVRDFWADLEQLRSSTNHYTGVLTLEEVPQEECSRWDDDRWIVEAKHFTPYYVVDGQQRLTTIIILLQCLLEAIGPDRKVNYTSTDEIRKKFICESRDGGVSHSFIFGYEKDNPSYEYLKTAILLQRSDTYSTSEKTIYTHNLETAKKYFTGKLADCSLEDLEDIYTKVTQHLLFNVYTITREIDVFVAFETMNNRGKPLSHLELLKNRLIYLSTKFDVDQEEKSRLRRTINDSWKTIYHYLGRNEDRPLDDDMFLVMHYWLRFIPFSESNEPKYIRRRLLRGHFDLAKDELLNSIFNVRNLEPSNSHKGDEQEDQRPLLTVEYIYDYAHDIKDAVRIYYEVFNPQDGLRTSAESIWLEKLHRLADPYESLLIFAVYRSSATTDERTAFLELLEKVLFIGEFTPYLRSVESLSFEDLASDLIAQRKNLQSVMGQLRAWLKDILKNTDFKSVIRNWAKRAGYRWRGLQYFYFEYEQELKARSRTNREKLTWEEFARERYYDDYTTLEHIYPQKASDPYWKGQFADFSLKQKNVLREPLIKSPLHGIIVEPS